MKADHIPDKGPGEKLLFIFLLSVAFGFLEAATVIYLRSMYYPGGFSFPLNSFLDLHIYFVEILREAATMLIIFSAAALCWKDLKRRFLTFFLIFGIWDIFYYVFLKIFLDWPAVMSEFDVLFLIPITWTGPVWAPVCVSVIFIASALFHFKRPGKISILNYGLFLGGLFLIYFSFTIDYYAFLRAHDFFSNPTVAFGRQIVSAYVPGRFPVEIFIPGTVLVLTIFFDLGKRKPRAQ